MFFSEQEILYQLQKFLFPFFRIAMLVMVMPVVSSKIVQARVRLAISVLLTFIVLPVLPPMAFIPLFSLSAVLVIIQEVLVGLVLGFSFQVVFQVFILAGQFIAMKMGLGFASMNDPNSGLQTTILSQFFLLLTTLVFVSINGHLILLELLIASFHRLPPGNFTLNTTVMWQMALQGQWMFAAALLLALPVMTALLFINIAFGVMSRTAPQLNIFSIGFPFTLLSGLFVIWLWLANFMGSFNNIIATGFELLKQQLVL